MNQAFGRTADVFLTDCESREPRIYFNFRELAQGRGRCWILKVLLSLWGWNVYSCLNVYYRILVCPTSFEIDLQV